MLRKYVSILISVTLLLLVLPSTRAQTTNNADKARGQIQKINRGKSPKVEIKLRDETKVRGRLTAVDDNGFTIIDSKSGSSRVIPYADVIQVKEKGNGMSARTRWIIIAGAVGGAAIVLYAIRGAFCDGC